MTLALVTVTADELAALVKRACFEAVVEAGRRSAATIERITAADAAAMVGKRRSLILAACASGALPAKRSGSGASKRSCKSWSIRTGDLDIWASAGCPEARS
mgnify:CR=1 FL=1